MVSKGNHPQMAARFRLVNYYNLPSTMYVYIYIYICYVTTAPLALGGPTVKDGRYPRAVLGHSHLDARGGMSRCVWEWGILGFWPIHNVLKKVWQWLYMTIYTMGFSSTVSYFQTNPYMYIYWLVVWNMNFIFPYIGNVIIPTDFRIFFRGVGQPPTRF